MREAGALAGGIDVRRRADQRVNVSYFVGPDHRGRGLGARAVRLVAAWVLAEWSTPALVGVVDEANIASRRTLENAGFVLDADRPEPWEHSEAGPMVRYSLSR